MPIIDYPDGSTDAAPIVLTDDSTQLQVLTGSASQSGLISESGGSHSLEKTGSGTLYLDGDTNTYSGGTTISAGTLDIDSFKNLGSGDLTFNGGTLNMVLLDGTPAPAITLNAGGGTISNGFNSTIASAITGAGSLTKTGLGTLILTGSNAYGDTIVSNGVLQIGNGGATGSLGNGNVADNGTLTFFLTTPSTVSGIISGSGGLAQAGSGALTLTAADTYTGETIINPGDTLALSGSGAIASSHDVAVNSGIFDISGTTSGASIRDLFSLDATGSVVLGAQTLTITNGPPASGNSVFAGNISGAGGVTISGGTSVFSGVNTYTGATTIASGATLQMGGSSLSIARSSNVAVNGTLNLNGINTTITSLSGSGAVTMPGSLTITAGAGTFSGIISSSGGGSLNITGGTTILTGNNTYAGGTTISAGATLQIGSGGTTGSLGNTAITDNGTLEFDRSDNTSFFNALSGSGNFIKAGSGTLSTGNGFGSFSGTVTIASGTLQISYGGSGPLFGTGSIIDNAQLTLTGNSSINTITDNISGTGNVTFNGGPVQWVITGTQTHTGTTTLSHGAILIGAESSAGGPTGSFAGDIVDGDVTSNVSLAFNRSNDYTYSGNISGLGEVDHYGLGTLTLTGTNTYSGSTYIERAALAVAGDSNLGTGPVILGGGSLRFLSSTSSARHYEVAGGAFDTNGFNVILTGTVETESQVNVAGGYGGLTKIGTGTLTLAGTDTFVGITAIAAGTLALQGSAGIASAADIVDNSILDISQTAGVSLTTLSGSGTVSLGSQTLSVSSGGGTTADARNNISGVFSGVIQDGGIAGGIGGSLVLSAGTEYLTGANTYTGTTTIASGATLVAGNNTAAGSLGSGAVTDNGTLAYNLTSDAMVANAISGSGGLEQDGSGTLTLTANNSYLGSTLISAGTLQIGNGGTSGALGAGAITDNGELAFDHSDNIVFSRSVSGSGDLTQLGSGTFTITVAQAYTGATGIETGSTLALSGAGSVAASFGVADLGIFDISQTAGASVQALAGSGTVALGGQTLTVTGGNYVFAGVIQDGGIAGGSGGGLTVSGGSLYLTGINTYSGATAIASGATLVLGNNTATGSLGSGAVADNGILAYFLSSPATLAQTVSGTGRLETDGSGALTITTVENYTGLTGINAGSTLALSGAGNIAASANVNNLGGTFDISGTSSGAAIQALAGSGTVALGSRTLSITTGNSYVFSGVIQDGGIAGGAGGGIAVNAGVVGLRGANTYTGATTIASGATLVIGNNTPGGSLGSGAVTDNGTLEYFLTSTATVANAISGAGGLLQVGSGNLILNAVDSYTGSTTVNAGMLSVNGSIASSATTVNSGGTLGGTGTVGTANISSGGTLAPGNSIGTLHVNGNLHLSSGANFSEEVSTATADEAVISGTASIAGNLSVNFASGAYTAGKTYTILSASGGLSGTFSSISKTGQAGVRATVSYDANDAYLTIQNGASAGFDGGGKADFLWQNDSGQAAVWLMNGTSVATGAVVGPNPGASWHVKGSGDFNGDGMADILWQNDSGQAAIWQMNGTALVTGPLVGANPGPSWHVKGAGDFNGDGNADILWQNDSGQAGIWLMNGATVATGTAVGSNPGTSWHIAGAGDFNGDGKADILWQNDSGQAAIWQMNGTTETSGTLVGANPGPSWHVKGVGDFNGDGNADILWQNDSGQAAIWLMNGSTVLSSALVGSNPGPSWQVVGAGDVNGDGMSDILWQNTNGQAGAWLMSGTNVISTAAVGSNPGTAWHMIASSA